MFINKPVMLKNDKIEEIQGATRFGTMAQKILASHDINHAKSDDLRIKFDSSASHDITYVGILQTAVACKLDKFPMPYVLTNCHNSLCAVGGTINEDDHMFGLSAVKRYGGIYVPAHLAVIHQYMREMMATAGGMILGSDSHTRYGALGTLAIGEGGGELAKQLLGETYNIKHPEVCLVYLTGTLSHGVGPHDVALYMIKKTFKDSSVKNMILEFAGPGVSSLTMDDRIAIDVMTTETACLSSVWTTDDIVKRYYEIHGRINDFKKMQPEQNAIYDCALTIDLSLIKPMIALPYHPSNAYTISDFLENSTDILTDSGLDALKAYADPCNKRYLAGQGIIAGCAGGSYENILHAAAILKDRSTGADAFSLSVYPESQPVAYALNRHGAMNSLIEAGVPVKTAFCGPCFGASDIPANNTLSVRHTTRNFENREGSIPKDGQSAYVALMDARSVAATAANKGYITAASEVDYVIDIPEYSFKEEIYQKRVYNGVGNPDKSVELVYGPNIKPWPEMPQMPENLMLKVAAVINDEVTTTDELIPSGETSSYRSNPLRLARFTLSRRVPDYVENTEKALSEKSVDGHLIYAKKPGDGSAREQAASSQRVLMSYANIALEYATKRYRSNLINWGITPFIVKKDPKLVTGQYIYIPGIKKAVQGGGESITAYVADNKEHAYEMSGQTKKIELLLYNISREERDILVSGSMINYYGKKIARREND